MSTSKTAERPRPKVPFASPRVYVLAMVEGDDLDGVHRVVRSETVVGRGAGVDVRLDDPEVSSRHCVLRVDGGTCTLADLGSRNGTRVNGRRMREDVVVRLRHLDEIVVGGTRMILLTGRFRDAPRPV